MNRFAALFVALMLTALLSAAKKPTPTASERAAQLLPQLTLGQKAAQMKTCSYEYLKAFQSEKGDFNQDSLKRHFPDGIGFVALPFGLDPVRYVHAVNSIRQYNKSLKLYIPPVFMGEGLHGFMAAGATVFPQAIALGSSWDTDLIERIYSVTALEASSRGVKQILSPVLDLAREPRLGRTEEMYSEDAYLTAVLGKYAVWGFQGREGKPDKNHVATTLKHFFGHGQPEGGRNLAPINVSDYDLLNNHAIPFEMAIKAGAMSVMPSYNEIDGQQNHANSWVMNYVLRQKLSFNGMVTADQDALRELYTTHLIVASLDEAAQIGVKNGIDIDLRYKDGAYDNLVALVESGKIAEKDIDACVERILTFKYALGAFEGEGPTVKAMQQNTNTAAHKALALEAAHKSLILLKNENNTLPFDSTKLKSVAVIGPYAKGVHLGGYTAEPRFGTDVLDGITAFAKGRFTVNYAEGCRPSLGQGSFWENGGHTPNTPESEEALIREAIATAAKSDVVVLVIGENVAFSREAWSEDHLGDRDNLDLIGNQNRLFAELVKTGKPIVALVFGGRPLSINAVAESAQGIVQVFYPGQEGGTAIADVLFGKVNPSAKLTVTVPKSVGQLPAYYSKKPSRHRSYIYFRGSEPLFPFGYGLSYTSFDYSKLTIDKTKVPFGASVEVSVTVTNSGTRQGDEIVQLYIHDVVSSSSRPILELKDFAKISLNAGESRKVTFTVSPDKLAFYNNALDKVVEAGDFDVFVGPNSQTLQKVRFTVEE